jgi:hypothetical protein
MFKVKLARVALILVAVCTYADGQEHNESTSAINSRTLDPKIDVERADLILLGYPSGRQYIGHEFSIPRPNRDQSLPPLRLEETQTNLTVIAVFKGEPELKQVEYTHYSAARDYPLVMGPPQGPSGPIGERGIFFLKRDGAILRSLVDVYRPDLPIPWISGRVEKSGCEGASDCIARLLLTFRPNDKTALFCSALAGNALLAQQMAGYLSTFERLRELSDHNYTEQIRHAACIQLSRMYALEFPKVCMPVISGTEAESEYSHRVTRLRQILSKQGLNWLIAREQFRPKDEESAIRDLKLMVNSADPATQAIASRLLQPLNPQH